MPAAVVDQDTPHQLCGDAQELLPIFPTNLSLIRQAKIGLVHQGSSPQGVIAALPPQVARRQTPQFRVEQNDQLGRRLVVADAELTQKGDYIWSRIHKDLVRGNRNRRERTETTAARLRAQIKKKLSKKNLNEGGPIRIRVQFTWNRDLCGNEVYTHSNPKPTWFALLFSYVWNLVASETRADGRPALNKIRTSPCMLFASIKKFLLSSPQSLLIHACRHHSHKATSAGMRRITAKTGNSSLNE